MQRIPFFRPVIPLQLHKLQFPWPACLRRFTTPGLKVQKPLPATWEEFQTGLPVVCFCWKKLVICFTAVQPLSFARTSWPTFDRASLLNIPSDSALLQETCAKGAWESTGLHWRNRFLMAGEVYLEKSSGRMFRSLGCRSGACLGWLVEHARLGELDGRASEDLPACWKMSAQGIAWFCLFSWSEYEAVPTAALSPFGIFARGMSSSVCAGICLWETAPRRAVLEHAALLSFRGLRVADLTPLAKELGVSTAGRACLGLLLCLFFF